MMTTGITEVRSHVRQNVGQRLIEEFCVDKDRVPCLRERHGVSLPRRVPRAHAGSLTGASTG